IRGDDKVELTDEESSDDEDEIAEDGYCNGGNFPDAYHIGNSPHYQDLEWYEALEDSELKDEALRNKAIMEGLISDDESNEEEYVAVKKDEYDDITITSEEACRAYQEIFRMMDEGWMDLVKEISTNIDGEFTNLEILKCWSLETLRRLFNTKSCSIKLNMENLPSKYQCVGDVVDFRTWLGISIRDRSDKYYGFRWSVTPPDGAWTEYVSGGVTLLSISSTKHKERPLRVSDQRQPNQYDMTYIRLSGAPWVVSATHPDRDN
ncbi:hypothetical protein Tco_1426267, partial [Tanacetum coccineum]